ncbi:MAG: histidine--tRNA ligase [Candidatus Taylorbacteria bacterium CG11_big_fil_rev_8_21_14_0_20_46_11]|uniref:Histidine--tRNA ligase n=1 Tax=Candidatus Taylorbacteria bacterium CG11_big_fil_rev_8_21_14_0_20_46_11 TaxID=1975025 RepID=A0A2H0KAV9_9BACT|nr:MAG: histidine--tRNA ligase [Candidatus Taylorbacteria bacterium CG11_big_fil_rev_8_21_14_0_20_46_11]
MSDASPKQPVSTDPYKGVRDFYPEDMAIQNYIFDTWKKVCKEFRFQEYATSLLEPAELYRSKGGGSDEIVNEQMFTFTDRGEREVALRPEMTPSLARLVAGRRKSLKFPLRWFTIANCFRYERPQRGRRREHWQLNADMMGISGIEAEAEIISLAYKIMKAFGAKDEDFEIRINDRKVIFEIFEPILRDKTQWSEVCRFLDRRPKLSPEEQEEGNKKYFIRPFTEDDAKKLHDSKMLGEIARNLKLKGILNFKLDEHLMRGFDYYTGMVFEVFDTDPENKRSLFGGGRYDNLLEMFGVDPVPTVGFGMGDVTIRDFLETHKLPLRNAN